jgi:hypothetical protein
MDQIMVEYSHEYLIKIFSKLKQEERENIGLMGGWAVYYLLKEKGIEHIGSRDIDLFFNPEKISFERIVQLINVEGFHPHSTFR